VRTGDILLGRFRLDRHVATGGSGQVFKAWDLELDRHVAVKILLPDVVADPQAEAELKREVRYAQALTHPNIVSVYEYYVHQTDGERHPFITMQWVDGPSLAAVIRQQPGGRLDVRRFLAAAGQLLSAVAEAHAQRIIHCDLKPANILVTQDGRLKVADFGIARRQGAGMTMTNLAVAISVDYAAPEQIRGETPTAQSDIYALGCVFYEMLAGRPPFDGRDLATIVEQHLHAVPAPIAGIGDALNGVLRTCLAKDPAARYRSVADVQAALFRQRRGAGARRPAWQLPRMRLPWQVGHSRRDRTPKPGTSHRHAERVAARPSPAAPIRPDGRRRPQAPARKGGGRWILLALLVAAAIAVVAVAIRGGGDTFRGPVRGPGPGGWGGDIAGHEKPATSPVPSGRRTDGETPARPAAPAPVPASTTVEHVTPPPAVDRPNEALATPPAESPVPVSVSAAPSSVPPPPASVPPAPTSVSPLPTSVPPAPPIAPKPASSAEPLLRLTPAPQASGSAPSAPSQASRPAALELEVPPNLELEADRPAGKAVDYAALVSASFGAKKVGVACAPRSGSTFKLGTTIVGCVAAGPDGFPKQREFTITIVDHAAPEIGGVIFAPADVGSRLGGGGLIRVDVQVTDAVDPNPVCAIERITDVKPKRGNSADLSSARKGALSFDLPRDAEATVTIACRDTSGNRSYKDVPFSGKPPR
jgi:tRNA A-37 threonylcarbamoyl transferase component Bud32